MPKKRISTESTPLDRFRELLSTHWENLLYLRKRVLKKSDPEDIHDLRIVLRRLRLMVKLFEYFTATIAKKSFKKALRNLTKTIGGLRNIDEALLFFQSRTNLTGKHPLCKMLSKKRTIEWQRIKKQLRLFDHQFDKLMRKMMTQLNEIVFTKKSNHSLLLYFANVSKNFSKTIHGLPIDSTIPEQSESRHALRIAIRKWRYSLEIIATVLNRDYDVSLQTLKKYQVVLGRLNDLVAFAAFSRDVQLSQSERKFVESSLLKEERLLLKKLSKLIREKPLIFSLS